ncbi:MAG: nickel-responsive transcriptional regulator NikR [Candidatus Pacebacteria bacterium]|nr:nickel-responsive transcriptional regulator NikR [Candidatus Paceibacterota bacterium]
MSDLVRLSFSIEKPLYAQLEKMVAESAYENRSEFIRDLIRNRLVTEEWDADKEVVGTITLIYDHHRRMLSERLTDLQHHHHEAILASTHVHLDPHMCAEVIIVKGNAGLVKRIADELRQQKGVLHAELSVGSTGEHLV